MEFRQQEDRSRPVAEEDLSRLPYSAVLRLEIIFGDNSYSTCSACLIGSCYALTVKYGVYHQMEGWASRIRVFLPRNKNGEPHKEIFVEKCFVFGDCELAVLRLNQDLDEKAQYFKMAAIDSMSDLLNKRIRISGYRYSSFNGMKMFTDDGEAFELQKPSFELRYSISTGPGQGGSPLFIEDSEEGQYSIIGVHTKSDMEHRKYGVLLNNERLKQIQDWIAQTNKKELKFSNRFLSLMGKLVNGSQDEKGKEKVFEVPKH